MLHIGPLILFSSFLGAPTCHYFFFTMYKSSIVFLNNLPGFDQHALKCYICGHLCADERPAGIEDTFLLCPAPVVEEVGR